MFLKQINQTFKHTPDEVVCSFLLGVHGLHELQEVCRKCLKEKPGEYYQKGIWLENAVIMNATDQVLTWGFMLGPGIPMAAICSMLGAPRPPNGVPPIWNVAHTPCFVCLVHMNTADVLHSPANSFTPLQWLTSGCEEPRKTAMFSSLFCSASLVF